MTARVFLVVANRNDNTAIAFAAAAAAEVRLMTPSDLSQPGWSLRLCDIAGSTAVLGGELVRAAAIAGVLNRLPGVAAHDLPHIATSDRGYVATEMTAFLLAWLTSLACPVVNRPTPQGLAGPAWRHEKWVRVAKGLGIPVRPVMRQAALAKPVAAAALVQPAVTTITVVGGRHIGEADAILVRRSHALAEAAGTDLLAVQFDGGGPDAGFVGASLWVDLADRVIAGAVMALLRERASLGLAGRRRDDIAVGHCAG